MPACARRLILRTIVFSVMIPASLSAQLKDDAVSDMLFEDRPSVAIIQYESGKILVVREIDGQLQVYEPRGSASAIVSRYLQPTGTFQKVRASQEDNAEYPEASKAEDDPMFFSPSWYFQHQAINTNEPGDRDTEAARQKAAEKRQEVKARRREQDTKGVTNPSGQVYPSTAADAEEDDRLARLSAQSGSSPYVTFYSLGQGLEYYRQQEIAARRELALLTYDVLLEEGLRFLEERNYGQAARSFIAASQKDRGDAGSRLHAAQALLSCGLYSQAMVHVRSAFELSPQLINRPLNHRTTYKYPADYDKHMSLLESYVQDNPGDQDAVILLAYELFFSAKPAEALEPMKQVSKLAETDRFAWKLCQAAVPVLGELD